MNPVKSLHEKAVLVKFVQHSWSGRKVDNKANAVIAEKFEVENTNIGRYHKQIFPKRDLAELAEVRRAAYVYHLQNTLPWMDGGVRMIPVANLKEYLDAMRKYETTHQAAVKVLIKNYAESVALGMKMQAKLADASEYPDPASLPERFGLETHVMQLPSTTDWRIDVPKQQLVELQKQAEQTLETQQRDALLDLWERLNETVTHTEERLSDSENTFRNSLFENLKDVVAKVAKLNFAEDPQLESVRKEIDAKLAKQTPDEIRADPVLRKKVAKDAADIMKKMRSYMGVAK